MATGLFSVLAFSAGAGEMVLVEAESFQTHGGWVVDQQFMDQMGSPYLLAHGMGVPVADAETSITIAADGSYNVFVRTKDWVAPYGPGRFQLLLNGQPLDAVFGTQGGGKWIWQDGGSADLKAGTLKLTLKDLTGFEGRCDAILLVKGGGFKPPDELKELAAFRRKTLGLPEKPKDAGTFDLVVAGGGVAGTCAAVAAARQGLSVALIQDRPVLGGNNSSEVRVKREGRGDKPFPHNWDILKELGSEGLGNGGPPQSYADEQKLGVVQSEKNIKLFLNTHVHAAEKSGDRIAAVLGKNVLSGEELRFQAALFVDCTGDGTLGFLAGSDLHQGRESQKETGETLAPPEPDNHTMGATNMWYAEDTGKPSSFPECPWALKITKGETTRADWNWETGFKLDQVSDAEQVRDHNFRAIYGTWDFTKNRSPRYREFHNFKLSWVAYVAGKRESRRLLGDVVLTQQDVQGQRTFPDACFVTTWSIDLHFPTVEQTKEFPGQEFRSDAKFNKITPYAVPFRCLYSRNVPNLFMAGRCISVTHVALGTVRVMNTCGLMGTVVGRAAYLCKKNRVLPRELYGQHLSELMQLLAEPGKK
ncbi:MAG: FAD-dependent oxidoreductase [Planctomycetota bacterium]